MLFARLLIAAFLLLAAFPVRVIAADTANPAASGIPLAQAATIVCLTPESGEELRFGPGEEGRSCPEGSVRFMAYEVMRLPGAAPQQYTVPDQEPEGIGHDPMD